jgi:hypothetical protein
MKRLLHQLFDALDELDRRNPHDLYNAVWFGMYWLGGMDKYSTEGKVPPPPPGVKDKRKLGETEGRHTLDQLKDRMTRLVDAEEHLHEQFLVVAYVRGVEDELDKLVAGYGKGKARMREDGADFQGLLDDPEELAAFVAGVREREPDAETPSRELLQSMVDLTKRESVATLTEMRERQESLELWRELTRPITDHDNLLGFLQQRLFGQLDDH